jgi:NDP-sugar pyrophosphorylase family protein
LNGTSAVVLAAGRSQRLGTMWPGLPKPMVPVADEPIVSRITRWLLRHDIGPVIVVWGPTDSAQGLRDGRMTAEYFDRPQWRRRGILLEPGRSAGSAADALLGIAAAPTSDVLVVGCDVVVDCPLASFLDDFRSSGRSGAVGLTRRTDTERRAEYGVLPEGSIVGRRSNGHIHWDRSDGENVWWGATFGVGVVRRETALGCAPPAAGDGFGKAVYDRLADSDDLYGFDNEDRFVVDIGTTSSVDRALSGANILEGYEEWPDRVPPHPPPTQKDRQR